MTRKELERIRDERAEQLKRTVIAEKKRKHRYSLTGAGATWALDSEATMSDVGGYCFHCGSGLHGTHSCPDKPRRDAPAERKFSGRPHAFDIHGQLSANFCTTCGLDLTTEDGWRRHFTECADSSIVPKPKPAEPTSGICPSCTLRGIMRSSCTDSFCPLKEAKPAEPAFLPAPKELKDAAREILNGKRIEPAADERPGLTEAVALLREWFNDEYDGSDLLTRTGEFLRHVREVKP